MHNKELYAIILVTTSWGITNWINRYDCHKELNICYNGRQFTHDINLNILFMGCSLLTSYMALLQ